MQTLQRDQIQPGEVAMLWQVMYVPYANDYVGIRYIPLVRR